MNLSLLLPEAVAGLFLLLMTLAEMFHPKNNGSHFTSTIAMIGAGALLLSMIPLIGVENAAFGGMFILDPFALFFKTFFALTGLIVILMSRDFFKIRLEKRGEFFLIVWSALIGLFFLVSANDFLLLFIALEITALSFYIMASFIKHDLHSIEAGLKYLILGSLASAFLLFGISLLYVASGSTAFPAVREVFMKDPANSLILMGVLCIISGLGFKVASVPFQLWVPDVYEGAPPPVVAYLSTASKAAGFALLLRLLSSVFIPFDSSRALLFSSLAAITLLFGNLGALVQTNIKRLFGYSAIGHAGYLLIGIAAGGVMGTAAVLYYLVAYALSNLAAFFVITYLSREVGNDQIGAFRGLSKRSPFLAASFFIALLSLAGVPPLAGFSGKFLILLSCVKAGLDWLALLGVLGVAVSLFYYLNVVRVMYIETPTSDAPIPVSMAAKLTLIVLVFAIFALGLCPAPFFSLASRAANSLF